MKKKRESIRFNTVPKGKFLIVTFWVCAIITAITGICVLLDHQSVGIGILLFSAFFVIWLVVLYVNQFSNVLTFTDEKIIRKKESISWDDVCITTYCFGPTNMLRGNNYENYCYFSDHYLSVEEVYSRKVKRKGFHVILTYKRAEYILSKYNKRVRMLNWARGDRDGTSGMIASHNAVLAKKEEQKNVK